MRAFVVLGVFFCLGVVSVRAAEKSREIQWRSGPAKLAPGTAELDREDKVGKRHVVIQFNAPLSKEQRKTVERLGVRLQAYLGADAYFATLPAEGLDSLGLRAIPTLLAVETIRPEWKLHPKLLAAEIPEFAIVESTKKERVAAVYVVFHADVDLKGEGLSVIKKLGGTVRSTMSVVNGAVVELPIHRISELAADDRVQWVEPPLPRLQGNNLENAQLIEARDPVRPPRGTPFGPYPYGLNGTDIKAMVYEVGTPRVTHAAFGGRLVIGTYNPAHYNDGHATHVAGTLGSNGGNTAQKQHAGMAPNVSMVSYEVSGNLYTDPGCIELDYANAINTHEADIANNSIGTNVESNGLDCLMQGDYSVTDQLIDSIVRGYFGSPFRVVWAVGNERPSYRCSDEGFQGYYSIAPPAGAKNHITVGAVRADDWYYGPDEMTDFSSWGPTDDGRMKPDVVAGGCQLGTFGVPTDCNIPGPTPPECGVQSVAITSDTAHDAIECGTSMAAPTVTGALALLLQDYRADSPEGAPLPRNSTLKVLLAQTAVDLGHAGPDYKFGYGSVRIKQAIDHRRAHGFREDNVTQGTVRSYDVNVPSGTASLKVTIAWDDYPGTLNISQALINDLDVIARAPDGTVHYPWTLNPSSPGSAAERTMRNVRDNIEQVRVDNPAAGTWRIEVTGYSVPQGPQPFSITASDTLYPAFSTTLSTADWERTPKPGFSTSCVNASGPVSRPTLCPQGDLEQLIEVTLVDETGAPIAGFPAEDIVATGSCRLLTTAGTDVCGPLDAQGKPTTWVNTVQANADTDAAGKTTITLVGAIGACSDLQVQALGVTLATLSFRSVDFSPLTGLTAASGILGSSEFNSISNSLGRTDRDWMDFNCNGVIDSSDYNFFVNGHFPPPPPTGTGPHKCRP